MTTHPSAAGPRLETKFLAFDPGEGFVDGRIQGYASLFDVVDGGGDAVAPGAFAAALRRADRKPKLLWQHDPARPIGVWETLREDARGLFVSGRLLTEIQSGAEAAALLRAGAIDGLSIGYRAVKAARGTGGGRRLLEIDLWEVSLVTFPMLPEARAVPGAGSGDDGAEALALAEALRAARDLFA
jgi:HK97 family phage prohead protease